MKITNFMILSFSIILISFFILLIPTDDYEYASYYSYDEESNTIKEIDTRDYTEDEILKQIAIDYFVLKEKNINTTAWLNIPNIGYYPVMYNEDNLFYLEHNEYDQSNKNGVPFLNNISDITFSNMALIHGHHIKNGKLFGSLKKYKNQDFFQKNEDIIIFDGSHYYFFKPFTVFLYEDTKEPICKNELEEIERLKYLNTLQNRSLVKSINTENIDLTTPILFLSTCDYTFEEARICIGSYLIKKISYQP